MTKKASIILDHVVLKRDDQIMKFDTRVEKGLLTLLLGANGSGKSTLLNIIAGFEKPSTGRVFINDQDMTSFEPAERPVSMIFQENNLFSHLTVRKNVTLGCCTSLRPSPKDYDLVSEALERTALLEKENSMPYQLSGGERQRVSIARCLVRQHPILLLDEPFSSLDIFLRRDMAFLIKELQKEKKITVLLVSHHIEDVQDIADRILFLNGIDISTKCPKNFLRSFKKKSDFMKE